MEEVMNHFPLPYLKATLSARTTLWQSAKPYVYGAISRQLKIHHFRD